MPANFSYANPLSNRTDRTPPLPPVSPLCSQASSPLIQDNNPLQRLSQPDAESQVRWAVFQSIHLQWAAATEQLPVQQFMTGRAPQHPH